VGARPLQSVLFACTYNALRSPMAAGLLKRRVGQGLYVQSAGLEPGYLDGFAIAVMREVGVDLSGHVPHTFESLGDAGFDLVIALSLEAEVWAEGLARTRDIAVEFWPTADPSMVEGGRDAALAAYRAVRDELEARIAKRFAMWSSPGL
jgi:protein-tyrosine-phosphatase